MSLKFKIVFYNVMIFLIIFDILYFIVWAFSLEMNPVKMIIVAGIASLLMPWARTASHESKRKVIIRSLAFDLYKKYQSNRIS